jgi:hypothetical protein
VDGYAQAERHTTGVRFACACGRKHIVTTADI